MRRKRKAVRRLLLSGGALRKRERKRKGAAEGEEDSSSSAARIGRGSERDGQEKQKRTKKKRKRDGDGQGVVAVFFQSINFYRLNSVKWVIGGQDESSTARYDAACLVI